MSTILLKKIWIVSRHALLITLIQCLSCVVLLAYESSAQSTDKVYLSVNWKNINLKDALATIEEKTGYEFFFKDTNIARIKNISLMAVNESLKEILIHLSQEKGLKFKRMNNVISVIKLPNEENDLIIEESDYIEREISGIVTDENGNGLPGVNVLVKNTGIGTISDVDGNYKLNISEDASVLVFSYVGYITEEVEIQGRTIVNISLSPDISTLSEIVVVGYGTVQKRDLTGAVTSVSGEEIQKTPATTFVQSLQGRVTGVDIRTASNAPGGGIRIRVRGTNSINASSEPLYVIDGFPVDNINSTPEGAGNNALAADPLSSISPSEIASVEVLKDASATAIYGARGANGVVIITTKRGKQGKAKIDFDYSLNVAKVRKKLDLANAEELAILTNEWAVNNGQAPIYDGVNRPLPEELGEGTDWQDVIFRTALTHTYNLSISGGTENTKYLLSGNYLDQDGIIIESNFKRAGIKFNLDQKISDRIKLGFNLNANRSVNDAVPSDGSGFQHDSPLWNALATTPVIPVRDADGNFVHNHDETVKILENPVSIAETRTDITYTNRVLSNAFVDIEVIKGLAFRGNFGADIINSKRNVYIPTTAETQALPNVGIASVGTVQSFNWLAEYTLTYNKEFGVDHRLTALAGYMVQTRQTENVFSRSDDFFTDKLEFNNLGVGSNPRPPSSESTETGLLSYLGRVNYIFKDKYILTGTIRRDGSSKFGEDNKWGVFPSAALAWRLGDENFMQGVGIFSDLKLRASYGLTGNQNINPYASLALYNTPGQITIIGEGPVIGLVPNRIPNPDLKWEKTAQFNAGMDMELLEGKINFSVDYYIKRTSDLLLNVSIPNQSGYGSSVQNIGEVENKGVEFSLGFNNTFGEVEWNSTFNISFNRNKLVSLPEGTERLIFTIGRGESAHGRSIAIPGEPLGIFYGYRFGGIWQTEEEIIEAGNVVGGINRPGLVRYEDLNGDGFNRNDDDREIVGDPNPDFIFGIANDFSYNNFGLSIFINGSYGNEIADLNRIGLLAQPQKHNVYQQVFNERWRGPGTSNTIEAPLTNAGEWKNFSDRDVLDGSFLRVKTINFSYNLPSSPFGMEWFRSAQVYIAGDNLITITNYTGFDPEVDLYQSSNVQLGVDNGAYPAAKSIRFGVKLGF